MNSNKNKRLCPNTPIVLMADGDSFRVGYAEKRDISGNFLVNIDGRFEVWARIINGICPLFICSMDEKTHVYRHFDNFFVSVQQKQKAEEAITQFVQRELRKQQQGAVYREELPDWARSSDNNPGAFLSVFETPNFTRAAAFYDPSYWKNTASVERPAAQAQFQDLWKVPKQPWQFRTQQGQSAPPGAFGRLYPEQWDMIQALMVEVRQLKNEVEILKSQADASKESPKDKLPVLSGENLDRLIRGIFLENGFTIEEGQTDLKPYVFTAVRALIAALTAVEGNFSIR